MADPSPDLRALNPASKEYLEAVFQLEEEGQRILQARIGERLGLAPATVSEGVRRLVVEGYVTIEGRDIKLTPSGRAVAETLVRRHRLAERMLTDILGIPWRLCHDQAEDWEKVMTLEVEEEKTVGDLVDSLRRIGDRGDALFFLDRELGGRA